MNTTQVKCYIDTFGQPQNGKDQDIDAQDADAQDVDAGDAQGHPHRRQPPDDHGQSPDDHRHLPGQHFSDDVWNPTKDHEN